MRTERDTVVNAVRVWSANTEWPHFEAQQIQLIQPAESTHVTQGRSGQTGSISHTEYYL